MVKRSVWRSTHLAHYLQVWLSSFKLGLEAVLMEVFAALAWRMGLRLFASHGNGQSQ